MSVVAHGKGNFVKVEVEEIINYMIEKSITSYSVDTSEGIGWDKELHRNFPRIARELRKKGLKVSSSHRWGVTEWRISF